MLMGGAPLLQPLQRARGCSSPAARLPGADPHRWKHVVTQCRASGDSSSSNGGKRGAAEQQPRASPPAAASSSVQPRAAAAAAPSVPRQAPSPSAALRPVPAAGPQQQQQQRPASSTAAAAQAVATAPAASPNIAPDASCSLVKNSHGLEREEYGKFVQFFRSASPYIEGHRARTFVVVIPGDVVQKEDVVATLMADIALLHGLGVRLVVVLGAHPQIDAALEERGSASLFIGGYRVTCAVALEAAVEAAGRSRTAVERYLSRGPSVPVFRRHGKGESDEMHFGPALNVVSGNYVAAKRRGIHDGIDFGYTGEVRFVARDAIRAQLDTGNIVLLSNLGFTAGGEVLNCNTYDVGLHAAMELGADKLICLHLDDVKELMLPQWLPLSQARSMLLDKLMGHVAVASIDADEADRRRRQLLAEGPGSGGGSRRNGGDASASTSSSDGGSGSGSGGGSKRDCLLDLDLWSDTGFPTAVAVSVMACVKGVKRSHLVDARLDGGMLLELYSRDGVGTMISTDFYEGIRRAASTDLEAIQALLEPLMRTGVLVRRTAAELRAQLNNFTVIERETKVMGCALMVPLGVSSDGNRVAEIGAFCVDVIFRGTGRGDSLLDYVEQDARNRGMDRLVLLTTRTADWFMQRDFKLAGPAWSSELLPASRRAVVNPARNSQLYYKDLSPLSDDERAEPGTRIGF